MTINLDDLVLRQAAILAEIDRLDAAELELLENPALDRDGVSSGNAKARRLLRGLVRSFNAGKANATFQVHPSPEKPGVIPSPPGIFLIELIPLAGGGFDQDRVMKIPVLAWKVVECDYAVPIVPGFTVGDRWSVLMPTGFVIADEFTDMSCDCLMPLKDWIRRESEWMADRANADGEFATVGEKLFQYSGPIGWALWSMMLEYGNWSGSPEELLELLSKFRGEANLSDWPDDAAELLIALSELEPRLHDAGPVVARRDDGCVFAGRVADLGPSGGQLGLNG